MRCLAGAMFGIGSKLLDHHPIDAWVRLSEPDLHRLDDVIEQRHHPRQRRAIGHPCFRCCWLEGFDITRARVSGCFLMSARRIGFLIGVDNQNEPAADIAGLRIFNKTR
jgi:hypothetical protein